MAYLVCHYCKKNHNEIEIKGRTIVRENKFIEYRICCQCSKTLAQYTPYQDKQKRILFLDQVKNQAIKDAKLDLRR